MENLVINSLNVQEREFSVTITSQSTPITAKVVADMINLMSTTHTKYCRRSGNRKNSVNQNVKIKSSRPDFDKDSFAFKVSICTKDSVKVVNVSVDHLVDCDATM